MMKSTSHFESMATKTTNSRKVKPRSPQVQPSKAVIILYLISISTLAQGCTHRPMARCSGCQSLFELEWKHLVGIITICPQCKATANSPLTDPNPTPYYSAIPFWRKYNNDHQPYKEEPVRERAIEAPKTDVREYVKITLVIIRRNGPDIAAMKKRRVDRWMTKHDMKIEANKFALKLADAMALSYNRRLRKTRGRRKVMKDKTNTIGEIRQQQQNKSDKTAHTTSSSSGKRSRTRGGRGGRARSSQPSVMKPRYKPSKRKPRQKLIPYSAPPERQGSGASKHKKPARRNHRTCKQHVIERTSKSQTSIDRQQELNKAKDDAMKKLQYCRPKNKQKPAPQYMSSSEEEDDPDPLRLIRPKVIKILRNQYRRIRDKDNATLGFDNYLEMWLGHSNNEKNFNEFSIDDMTRLYHYDASNAPDQWNNATIAWTFRMDFLGRWLAAMKAIQEDIIDPGDHVYPLIGSLWCWQAFEIGNARIMKTRFMEARAHEVFQAYYFERSWEPDGNEKSEILRILSNDFMFEGHLGSSPQEILDYNRV